MSGEIEIWDCLEKKKVGECKSASASFASIAPDGRKFITAILNPRLRVDNHFKVKILNKYKKQFL